jgi:hypothetical protein
MLAWPERRQQGREERMRPARTVPDHHLVVVVLLMPGLLGPLAAVCPAGVGPKLARESARSLLRGGSRELAGELGETLARRLPHEVGRPGEEALTAVRRAGPRALAGIARAGPDGPAVIRLFARHGEEAVWITSRPGRLAIFVRHGDSAAEALLCHRTIAESLIGRFDAPAVRALQALSPRQGRRLAMLADEGLLTRCGRCEDLLAVIARHGDRALEFLWQHRAVLASATLLASFLAQPSPYLDGAIPVAGPITVVPVQPAANPVREPGADPTGRTPRHAVGEFLATILGGLVLAGLADHGRRIVARQPARMAAPCPVPFRPEPVEHPVRARDAEG